MKVGSINCTKISCITVLVGPFLYCFSIYGSTLTINVITFAALFLTTTAETSSVDTILWIVLELRIYLKLFQYIHLYFILLINCTLTIFID